jgi:hypothetical protein
MKVTIGTYIKDRNNAMLAYPDTTKLEELVKNYPFLFSPQFKAMWKNAKSYVKIRTLEVMIGEWAEAPAWLTDKVKRAIAERKVGQNEKI